MGFNSAFKGLIPNVSCYWSIVMFNTADKIVVTPVPVRDVVYQFRLFVTCRWTVCQTISASRVTCAVPTVAPALHPVLFRYLIPPSPSPGDTLWCPFSYWPLWRHCRYQLQELHNTLLVTRLRFALHRGMGSCPVSALFCAWLLSAVTRLTCM